MSEWREVTLGDVATISWGDTSTTKAAYAKSGFPAYSATGQDGLLPYADHTEDGVVISAIGAQCGKTWYAAGSWSCIKNTLWMRGKPGLDTRFLFYATSRQDLWPRRGAAQPFIGLGDAKAMRLRIPDDVTQVAIGTVLGSMDKLIENNRRRVEVLEEMARAIYREWFVKFRYPGHEDVPLVDSPLGRIPEGWRTPQLADLVSTQYGYTESATSEPLGPRYLRGMDINKKSFIDWSSVPFCPIDQTARNKFAIQVGDVFVIRMADPGKVGICETEVDAVFESYLVRMRPSSAARSPYFLFFTLSDAQYQDWIVGASGGATRKSVSSRVMTEPPIVLPPPELQQAFEGIIVPMRKALTVRVRENAKLTALRDLLLPKLVTGQIDVSTLDLDALISSTSSQEEMAS